MSSDVHPRKSEKDAGFKASGILSSASVAGPVVEQPERSKTTAKIKEQAGFERSMGFLLSLRLAVLKI
jgi:hypothetical protein